MPVINEALFDAAGKAAEQQYNDKWFAIDLSKTGEVTESGTVIIEYQGMKFEVWLENYFLQNA